MCWRAIGPSGSEYGLQHPRGLGAGFSGTVNPLQPWQ